MSYTNRALALAVILFPLLAGEIHASKDSRHRTECTPRGRACCCALLLAPLVFLGIQMIPEGTHHLRGTGSQQQPFSLPEAEALGGGALLARTTWAEEPLVPVPAELRWSNQTVLYPWEEHAFSGSGGVRQRRGIPALALLPPPPVRESDRSTAVTLWQAPVTPAEEAPSYLQTVVQKLTPPQWVIDGVVWAFTPPPFMPPPADHDEL